MGLFRGIRRLGRYSAKVYVLYRDAIWRGYNFGEAEGIGKRASWRYYILPSFDDMESHDLLSLVWLAVYARKVKKILYREAEEEVESFEHSVKLRPGELLVLKRIASILGTNSYALLLAARDVAKGLRRVYVFKRKIRKVPRL